MLQRINHSILALILAFGFAMAHMQPAEAGRGGRVAAGVAAGIITLGILGAYANSRGRHYHDAECYRGPRRCRWVRGGCWHDRYGDYVCRRSYRKCWRPLYCD
ncbi:MAG: hypothetical protein AAF346_25690 [Pseudomonadota bacterium]